MDGIMLIAEGAFKLLLGFAAAIVIPLLVSKLGAQRMEKLAFWVEIFVRAAEQTFAGTEGAAKKAYVLRLLQERGIDIDAAEVDAMIEGAVQVLHSTLHGLFLEAIAEFTLIFSLLLGYPPFRLKIRLLFVQKTVSR